MKSMQIIIIIFFFYFADYFSAFMIDWPPVQDISPPFKGSILEEG